MSNTGNNILFIDAVNPTTIGLGAGDDRYVLSGSNLAATQTITIDDSQGVNTLQLVGGLAIASSQVFNNAIQLKLSNGATVNVLNASTFKFLTGGDAFTGTGGLTQTFNQFVTVALGSTVPAAGAAPAVSVGSVTLPNPGGGTATPTFSITGAAAVAEGASATYTVTLSAAQSGATSVDYTLAGTGGAVLGTDTGVVANGTLNFAAGEVTKTIVVPFSSDVVSPEVGEGVSVTLSGPSLGTALSATAAAVTTAITDVPVAFSVAANAAAVAEGDSVTFTVNLSVAQATASTVTYTLTGAGGAVLGTDTGVNAPVGNTGTLTFAAGEMSKTIVVPIAKDTISPEAGEGVTLTLATPSVGALSATAAAATATITDKPVSYTLIAAASVYEGAAITYTLTASAPASVATTVDFSVVPGASTAANDQGTGLTNLNDFTQSSFNPTSFVIAAGATTATYVVTSATDSLTELPETYSVKAVIGGTEVATVSTTLLDGISATAGQTFTLTKDVDQVGGVGGMKGSGGSTSNALDDTIVGTISASAADSTFDELDAIDGGLGINTLKISAAVDFALPAGATVTNIQTVQINAAAKVGTFTANDTGALDLSTAFAGATALTITNASEVDIKAPTTAAVNVSGVTGGVEVVGGASQTVSLAAQGAAVQVSGSTGAVSVTSTKQATAGTIDIDGGSTVTVATTSTATNAVVTIGASTSATGAVSVTSNLNGDGTASIDQADISVKGGSTVTVNSNLTIAAKDATASKAHTFGDVAVTGDGKTTSVTVNQTYAETEFTKAGTAVVKEADTVTFKAMTTGQTLIATVGADVLTFKATKALTADQVATAFANLVMSDTQSAGGPTANGYYTGNFSSVWSTAAASGATVVFTAKTHAETNVAWTGTAAAPTVVNAPGTAVVADTTSSNTRTFGAVIIDDNATAAIKTISVNGYGTSSIGDTVAANALETLTLSNSASTMKVDSTSKTLALNVNNVTHAVNLDDTSADVTTLTINATGKASSFALTAEAVKDLVINADVAFTTVGTGIDGALKTVDINGVGAVNLGDIAAAALKTFNAADNTGGVTATISAKTSVLDAAFTKYVFSEGSDTVTLKTVDVNKAIDLGAGNDTIELEAGVRIGDITANIDGGTGTNTLTLAADDAEALSAANTFNAKIDKFQHLTIGAAASQEVVNLDNIDAISYVTLGSAAGTAQVSTLTVGGTIEIGDIFTATVNGATYSFTATAATLANVSAGLRAAVLTGAPAGITVGADGGTGFTLTAAAPGVPFTATVATTEAGGGAADAQTLVIAPTTPNAYSITLNNLANNGTVSLTDNATVLVSVKDAALVTSTTDVLNLQTQVNGKSFAVTANDVETIKVNAIDTYTAGGVANKDATTLAVVADKATKVMVSGDGYVSLSTTAAVLTEVDAGTMTGGLTYTAKLASLVVKGGLGVDSLTAAGDDVKLYGGAGDDTLTVTSGLRVNLYGDAGKDTFVFNAGASNTLDAYTVINGVSTGDVIKMTGATAFSGSKIALSVGADETLLNYANQAIKTLGLNEMGWFEKGGNTFIVKDGHNTTDAFDTTTDMIIMITGVVNLGTGASYNSTSNILEIV